MEKFLQALTENEKVREDFLNQKTAEGAYSVAKPYIGNMSMDEFVEQLSGIASAMDKMQSGEIDDDALEAVSGGVSWSDVGNFFKSFGDKTTEVTKQISSIGQSIGTAYDDISKAGTSIINTFKQSNN